MTMRIQIHSLFPQLISYGYAALQSHNPRDFSDLRYRGEPNVLDVEGLNVGAFFSMREHQVPRLQLVYFTTFSEFGTVGNGTSEFTLMTALHKRLGGGDIPSALWSRGEPASETAWRTYARHFTAMTKPPRNDVDLEAHAFEVEEAAYGATNLHTSRANFINAAVEDYERETHTQHAVFVYIFEDMHLSPQANRSLRQIVRPLVHPRLAFVFSSSSAENTLRPSTESVGRRLYEMVTQEPPKPAPPPKPPLMPHARILLGDDDL